MDRRSLQEYVEIHRTLSTAMLDHFRRHWQREPSPDEINVVQSHALCGSFMSQESLDQGLSLATTKEKVDEIYDFMKSEVIRKSQLVIEKIQNDYPLATRMVKPEKFPNLLMWEEALLAHVRDLGIFARLRAWLSKLLRQQAQDG